MQRVKIAPHKQLEINMTEERASAFIEKSLDDEDLKVKFIECKNADEVVALGKEHGFEFTTADLSRSNAHASVGEWRRRATQCPALIPGPRTGCCDEHLALVFYGVAVTWRCGRQVSHGSQVVGGRATGVMGPGGETQQSTPTTSETSG